MTDKLDFSRMRLKEIELITEKPKVLIFDHNEIGKIDKLLFQAQLQQLSIAHNEIIQINGLTTLHNLTVLNLSYNKIINVDGLKTLKNLTWLCLSNNRIKKFGNLEHNLMLKHLDLSDNMISRISNINYLNKLKTLLLHGNEITTLEYVEKYLPCSIEILSLAENCLSDLTEVQQIRVLSNLKQLSVKENPCVNIQMFDHRPYLLFWCQHLSIIDGKEVTEKEKLITEWLMAQGDIKQFKLGQHYDLVQYLTQRCSLTNMKNKSKLETDLENILEQRKKLSSRMSNSVSRSVISKDTTTTPTISEMSTDVIINQSFSNTDDDENTSTDRNNSSMLMSESSFIPLSSPKTNHIPNSPTRGMSPSFATLKNVLSAVPTIKYSNETPAQSRKSDSKRTNMLNMSFDDSVNSTQVEMTEKEQDSVKMSPVTVMERRDTLTNNNSQNETDKSLIPDSTLQLGQKHQRNNSAVQSLCHLTSKRYSNIPIGRVTTIQAWWRGIRTRQNNPTVRRYLASRESNRTKAHILFLQKQMQLYYESYDQQRKLNATQSQAITFLIDQVKNLTKWKDEFSVREKQYMKNWETKLTMENRNVEVQVGLRDDNDEEREHLLNRLHSLEEEVTHLKETVWKLESSAPSFALGRPNGCRDIVSISSNSEISDLNKVINEAERIVNQNSENANSESISQLLSDKHDQFDDGKVITNPNDANNTISATVVVGGSEKIVDLETETETETEQKNGEHSLNNCHSISAEQQQSTEEGDTGGVL